MIKINYFQNGNSHRLTVDGHAGYSDRGNDIVCAAVSAISWTLIGYLMEEEADYTAAEAETGHLEVSCTGEKAEDAFSMAVLGYQQIEKKYPQCVEVHMAE